MERQTWTTPTLVFLGSTAADAASGNLAGQDKHGKASRGQPPPLS